MIKRRDCLSDVITVAFPLSPPPCMVVQRGDGVCLKVISILVLQGSSESGGVTSVEISPLQVSHPRKEGGDC